MSYQIITDSCCDFTDEEYRSMGVTVAPLSVVWDGEVRSHFSTREALKDFYAGMRRGLAATTSALNPVGWARAMESHLQAGQDLLVLTVSSGISATCQSAVIAARELAESYPQRRIEIVDSLSGSLGQGLLLHHACRLRDEGAALEDNARWLRENAARVCHWVTVDDLSYLKRSGRLSSAGALLGTMLDIKPIIRVTEEGKLTSDSKVRGRKASVRMLAKKYAESRDGGSDELVTIAHGDCPGDAEALAEILRREYGVEHIHIGYVGPVLGAHTGPGVLGLFHLGIQR